MPGASDSLIAVVLAAGGGSRLGGGKLLLPWLGKPILVHVLDAIAAAGRARAMIVVIGHDAEKVGDALREHRRADGPVCDIVENPHWREGQSTSLRCGVVRAASEIAAAPGGVMVLLGDQPRVRPATLRLLADSHAEALARNARHPATVPVHQDVRGNPVIFSPLLFPRIMELRGDVGARQILAELGPAVLAVPVDDPGVLRDVDTPEAYQSLLGGEQT